MNDILELRKDINMPGCYQRAGKRATRAEWETRFPGISDYETKDWFLLIKDEPEPPTLDAKQAIVKQVFAKHGLHSISYRQAALECINEYQKQLSDAT